MGHSADERVKIAMTVGPASADPAVLRRLIEEGVDGIRINASHVEPEGVGPIVSSVRKAARKAGSDVAILLDLQGPKLRIGAIDGMRTLEEGERVVLSFDGKGEGIAIPGRAIRPVARRGVDIYLDDGMLKLRVTSVKGNDVFCRVVVGGTIRSRVGINLPGSPVPARVPTARDLQHVRAGIEAKVDLFALSFVRSEKDLIRCRKHAAGIPIVAKIERPEAVERIEQVAEASDGILVARGDLAVEMKPEDMPALQKRLIAASNSARKPVMVATELLASMVHAPRPTRAELTDVANAVLDGADTMLLTDETAIGENPVRAIQVLGRILSSVERSLYRFNVDIRQPGGSAASRPDWALADAAVETAFQIGAKAIVAVTGSGRTARLISAGRPSVPLYAYAPDPAVLRRISLMWGVQARPVEPIPDPDLLIQDICDRMRKQGRLAAKDRVVFVYGAPLWGEGTKTNTVRLAVA